MNKYIINEATLVLFSLGNKTQIYEKYRNIIVDEKMEKILDQSCKYYGSSLKGRCEATEYLTGIKYKCPIIISEKKNLIFFPTSSLKKEECVWINYKEIDKYYINNKNLLIVEFKNNKNIIIDVSNNIISNQILKSSRLESIILNNR